MTRKLIVVVIFIVLCLNVISHPAILSETVCPPSESVTPPFSYDPEECQYRIIGSLQMNTGDSFSTPIGACDPDGDSLSYKLDNQPEGMTLSLSPAEPNTVILAWKALAAGIYYPNIIVSDMPADSFPLSDNGTIVIRVWRLNQTPVLVVDDILTCCGVQNYGSADLNFDGKVDFADFAIFTSCWLKEK